MGWDEVFNERDALRAARIVLTGPTVGAAAAMAAAMLTVAPPAPMRRTRRPEGPPRPELKDVPGTRQRKRWLQRQARKKNR